MRIDFVDESGRKIDFTDLPHDAHHAAVSENVVTIHVTPKPPLKVSAAKPRKAKKPTADVDKSLENVT